MEMPNNAASEEPTLAVLLHRVAGRVNDAQAAVACGLGTLGAAGIALFAPHWWRLSLAALALACFGLWIVLDRNDNRSRWLMVAQGAAAVVGAACTFAIGLSLLTVALGIWIS